jgi:hypothetical protein
LCMEMGLAGKSPGLDIERYIVMNIIANDHLLIVINKVYRMLGKRPDELEFGDIVYTHSEEDLKWHASIVITSNEQYVRVKRNIKDMIYIYERKNVLWPSEYYEHKEEQRKYNKFIDDAADAIW